MKERYLSVIDNDARGRNTVEARIRGVERTASTIIRRPILGHGLGTSKELNYTALSVKAQPTHNLYIEILQEIGIIGFIIFTLYIISLIKNIDKAFNISNNQIDPFINSILLASKVWIFMQLIYSLASFGLSLWDWYLMGGIITAASNIKTYKQDGKSHFKLISGQP
jgi:O-antigen ligase